MKPIEKKIIQLRKSLIRRSYSLFKAAIKAQYKQGLDIIANAPISNIEETIKGTIKSAPVEAAFYSAYSSASAVAIAWRTELLSRSTRKKGDDELFKSVFERSMLNYAKTKAGKRIKNITETTEEYILTAVRSATTQAVTEGLGIAATRELILSHVVDSYEEITTSRAQTIAQTEMITASNQAAMDGARSTGLEFRKFWSTSGLERTRDSHLAAELESINAGGLKEDERFANGLLHPGDPDGDAAEVINCRCSILIEIV